MKLLQWLSKQFISGNNPAPNAEDARPDEHIHDHQQHDRSKTDNHHHTTVMVLKGKPKVENACETCGTFSWDPPEIVAVAYHQHPEHVQHLMNQAWAFAALITMQIVVAAKCPHAAIVVRKAFAECTGILTVSGDIGIRRYEELVPKDLDRRWVVNKDGHPSVDINCPFCGHIIWLPPEFVNSLEDEKRHQTSAITATMLHLAMDLTMCFFHCPPLLQMLFSPAYTHARDLLLLSAITPIAHTAEEAEQCHMEDQREFMKKLFDDQK